MKTSFDAITIKSVGRLVYPVVVEFVAQVSVRDGVECLREVQYEIRLLSVIY